MSIAKAWKCDVCGYVHQGDEPPETCPLCGVGREMFSILEIVTAAGPPQASLWRCTICDYQHQGDAPPETCSICDAAKDLFAAVQSPTAHSVSSTKVSSIVVIGAGIAGLTAVEQARIHAPQAEITMINKEPVLPYYRLNLTRFVAGEVGRESLNIHSQQWFDDNNIRIVYAEITGIDRKQQQVQTRNGDSLGYDRLILASGSHAFVPSLPGVTRDGVYVLRTLDNAENILQQIAGKKHCVCIGGGLLGLETAGALKKRGLEVTVLEGFQWLLPRQLSQNAGTLLMNHVEKFGIKVRCGVRTKEIIGDETVRAVVVDDDEEIAADIVIIATGIRPNSYLARQCQLKVNKGILVNDRLETSDPHIFAAGDVCEHRGYLYGIWPASYAQGVIAGINAAGGSAELQNLPPSTRLKVLDVDVFSIGDIQIHDASYRILEHQNGGYRCLICRDGKIIAANLLGDTSLAAPIKEAIESQMQISELPNLMAQIPELAE